MHSVEPVSCKHLIAAGATLVLLATSQAAAQETDDGEPMGEIVVFGRSVNLLGSAGSASEGSIAGADLLVRPMLKVAELLESVPGMVAVQHSGTGKANQYFLRGFNLDHGTDFTAYVDGMPWNLRSHGHGQGYLDMNALLPEVVERIDYRKGPYHADLGDFSLAGAADIRTVDRLERPFVSGEVGEYGWRRFTGGLSRAVRGGTFTLAGEAKSYDGPWEHAEGLSHVSVWSKYVHDVGNASAAYTLSFYDGNWHPTEQIPERVIGSAVCADEFCTLDPSPSGDTKRWIGTARFSGAAWNAVLFLQHYDWSMQSNPTYDFQLDQFDERYTAGGKVAYDLAAGDRLDVGAGIEFRYDDIRDVGLDENENGVFVANIARNGIGELSAAAWVQASWRWTDQLRMIGGLRGDWYDFDVDARSAGSAEGNASDRRGSPKLGIAWAMTDALELYGNWGRGFHSNDARGVVNDVDPVPGMSPGEGYETGLRYAAGNVNVTATYWWLEQDSELVFVGDSNSVEPKGGSEREGYELTMFWKPYDWLGIDTVYTQSKARYTDNDEGRYVENAVEQSAQLGFSAVQERWEASLRLRYLGPYALLADNSQRADPLTTVGMRAARHWDRLTLYAELINALDDEGKDISYYYGAYVEGFDAPGLGADDIDCGTVNCRMSRATEPRTLRVGVSYKFR